MDLWATLAIHLFERTTTGPLRISTVTREDCAGLLGSDLSVARCAWSARDPGSTVRCVTRIAGTVELDAVMDKLRLKRPIFHSEADFQHAFGQVLHELAPALRIRLEVRQENAEHLDLLCFGSRGRTAVEFKYVSASWQGIDATTGESFRLRSHAADDLARRNFVFDVERLERFCRVGGDGLAIMLTNMPAL